MFCLILLRLHLWFIIVKSSIYCLNILVVNRLYSSQCSIPHLNLMKIFSARCIRKLPNSHADYAFINRFARATSTEITGVSLQSANEQRGRAREQLCASVAPPCSQPARSVNPRNPHTCHTQETSILFCFSYTVTTSNN